jgi:hypothetical protein
LLAACSGGDDLDLVFVEVDERRQATIVLVRGDDLERIEVDGVTLAGALTCSADGAVLLDGFDEGGALPPLFLEDGQLVPLEGVPPGGSPSFAGDDRFAWEEAGAEDGLRVRMYNLDGQAASPYLPGDDPFWLGEAERLAVEGPPGSLFDQLGIYAIDPGALPAPDESVVELDVGQYSERISPLPSPTVELDPAGRRVAYVTAAQENEQNDVQVIDVDGRSNARTLTATPEQETNTRWTRDGRIVFVRHQLLEQNDPGDGPADARVMLIDPETGAEDVVASGRGIEALAACY